MLANILTWLTVVMVIIAWYLGKCFFSFAFTLPVQLVPVYSLCSLCLFMYFTFSLTTNVFAAQMFAYLVQFTGVEVHTFSKNLGLPQTSRCEKGAHKQDTQMLGVTKQKSHLGNLAPRMCAPQHWCLAIFPLTPCCHLFLYFLSICWIVTEPRVPVLPTVCLC